MPDQQTLKHYLLQAASVQAGNNIQTSSVLSTAWSKVVDANPDLQPKAGAGHFLMGAPQASFDQQKALLCALNDLVRTGSLAWGHDFANLKMAFLSVNPKGQNAIAAASRDPSNEAGYLALLDPVIPNPSIPRSYIAEAVHAYNSGCPKAAAVLLGGSAEALVLELRDEVVAKLRAAGTAVNGRLEDWRVKTVRDQLTQELENRRAQMPHGMRASFDTFWKQGTEVIRQGRNDAGHPSSLDPITDEWVHGTLLLFPALAEHIHELKGWVAATMTP